MNTFANAAALGLTDDDFDERGILKDGRGVRVPLVLMDAVQQSISQNNVTANLTDAQRRHIADERRISIDRANADAVRRQVDFLAGQDAARQALIDADPRESAYQKSVRELQAGSTFK